MYSSPFILSFGRSAAGQTSSRAYQTPTSSTASLRTCLSKLFRTSSVQRLVPSSATRKATDPMFCLQSEELTRSSIRTKVWPEHYRPKEMIYAPHWYDLNALFTKSFGFMTVNVQGLSRVRSTYLTPLVGSDQAYRPLTLPFVRLASLSLDVGQISSPLPLLWSIRSAQELYPSTVEHPLARVRQPRRATCRHRRDRYPDGLGWLVGEARRGVR
jgi:hypothetical protein